MRYYLARYVGAGTEADPFQPDLDGAGDWQAVDLRPDPTVAQGWALVATEAALTSAPNRRYTLGDDPDGASVAVRNSVQQRLGLTLASTRLRQIVRELLIEHGDLPGRWRALRPEQGGRYRIWLGGLFDEFPVVAGGATVSDDFNRADSTNLGASWTELEADWSIASNKLRLSAGANRNTEARYESDLAGADHYAAADVTWVNASSPAGGTAVRFSSSAKTYYRGVGVAVGDVDRVDKSVIGAVTIVASQTHTIGAETLNIRTEANGSSISVKVGAAATLPVTDTAITAGTRCGVAGFSSPTAGLHIDYDNWTAADLTAAVARSFGGVGGLLVPTSGPVAVGGVY